MNHVPSPELLRALEEVGRQVDDLIPPDLKTLALALNAERERVQKAKADLQRQMQAARVAAITRFTQLLLCARQDVPLTHTNYFESVARLRELTHD